MRTGPGTSVITKASHLLVGNFTKNVHWRTVTTETKPSPVNRFCHGAAWSSAMQSTTLTDI